MCREVRKDERDGGVIIIERSGVKVMNVEYGHEKAEIVSVEVKRKKKSDNIKVTTVYVPPRTNKSNHMSIKRC